MSETLPAISKRDSQATIIAQPNSVTFAHTALTRTQLCIFAYIMKELQAFVTPQLALVGKRDPDALHALQLTLFTEIDNAYFIDIPKQLFVKSNNYKQFKNELQELSTMPIAYKKRNPKTGKIADYHTTILSVYHDSDSKNNRNVSVEIKRETMEVLTMISTVSDPINSIYSLDYYTNYTFETLNSFTKKYTGLLYLYLSSWKSKGGWKIPTKELRNRLNVPADKYTADRDFKKHVLNVAGEEMKEKKSDIWFEASFEGSYTVFKIITEARQEITSLQQNKIVDLLKTRFGCTDIHINEIRHIISDDTHFQKIQEIMIQCFEAKVHKKVNSPADYVIVAIKNWYKNLKRITA